MTIGQLKPTKGTGRMGLGNVIDHSTIDGHNSGLFSFRLFAHYDAYDKVDVILDCTSPC